MSAQCGILFIGPCGGDGGRLASLRSLGFRVEESVDIPSAEEVAPHHAVIVRALGDTSLTMLAARLRGKPHLDRRVLVALVAHGTPERTTREAVMAGFDTTLPDTCSARDIAASILRLLRAYPEYRCLLRAPHGRRKAA